MVSSVTNSNSSRGVENARQTKGVNPPKDNGAVVVELNGANQAPQQQQQQQKLQVLWENSDPPPSTDQQPKVPASPEKPTMKALAMKSILKTRQEKARLNNNSSSLHVSHHQHARIVLPNETVGPLYPNSCVIDLSTTSSSSGMSKLVTNLVTSTSVEALAASGQSSSGDSSLQLQGASLDHPLSTAGTPDKLDGLSLGPQLASSQQQQQHQLQPNPQQQQSGQQQQQQQGNLVRQLELAIEDEPEELDLKLLFLAKKGDWTQVEEMLNNKRQYLLLKAMGPRILRATVTEGSLWTTLHYVAKDNKWQLIERLIKLGLNVNARAHDQMTPLHLGCLFMPIRGPDCEATIRSLLSARADPMIKGGPKDQLPCHILAGKASLTSLNALNLILDATQDEARLESDSEGNIPLIIAIQAGNEGAVQDLLLKLTREQLHYRHLIHEDYAIHLATKQKDIEILKLVIDSGCNLDLQNGKGQTALHLAAANEMEEFVRLLCQAGADPDVQDNEHQSPIHLATAKGYQRIVEILTEKFKASIMYRTKDGSTLMHLASSAYNAQAALSFIRKGIPIHMPNKEGAKCIHIASIRGHVEVVKAIVAKGENVDSRTKDGFTPLHLAVKFGKHDLVEALLGLGANLQLKAIKGGETALHLATLVSDGQECVDLLIRSGADVDALDSRLETPLHFACKANNIKAVELLLDDGAKLDAQNEEGENILHICVRESNLSLIRDVIIHHVVLKRQVTQAKKLINQTNNKGESSLHYAAKLTGDLSHHDDEDSGDGKECEDGHEADE